MKKALISSNEPVVNFDSTTGYRIAEVKDQPFEVCPALFWVDCPEDCQADLWFYNTETEACEPKPVEVIEVVTEGGA